MKLFGFNHVSCWCSCPLPAFCRGIGTTEWLNPQSLGYEKLEQCEVPGTESEAALSVG
jgi:hypothetical protein